MTISSELLKTFTIVQVRAYLEATGWQVKEKFSDKGLVYANSDETLKALLPLKNDFADYTLRLAEIIQTLSAYEDKNSEQILRAIQLSSFDVFRIRLTQNAVDGTVPLSSTENIIEKARKMLAASASSVIKPSKVHSPRKGKQVEEFMDKVRLGQTEYGSYIFTLLTPIVPEIEATLPLPFEEPISRKDDPFDRLVTNKLNEGINTAYDEAIKVLAGEKASFEDKVDNGISAALCEGLSSITKESGSAEFSVSWAKTRPHIGTEQNSSVEFTLKTAEVIEEVARVFKLSEPQEDLKITGYVSHLSKDKMDPTGNVVIKGLVDGQLKPIRMTLNDEEYATAINAHEDFKTIVVEGDLVSRGKFKVLDKVRNFSIDYNENENDE